MLTLKRYIYNTTLEELYRCVAAWTHCLMLLGSSVMIDDPGKRKHIRNCIQALL